MRDFAYLAGGHFENVGGGAEKLGLRLCCAGYTVTLSGPWTNNVNVELTTLREQVNI